MFQKGLFLWSYEFSKRYVNFSDEIFGQKNFFPKLGIDGPNVISIESSHRAERENIFFKIFLPFCTKLQKVEIFWWAVLLDSYDPQKSIADSSSQQLKFSPHPALQDHSQTRKTPGLQKTAMSS